MYNYEQTSDLKIRSAPRFEKPLLPFPNNPGNFLRRPAFPLRRRMMPGRYPNTGLRPFAQPAYRPNYSMPPGVSPEYRYHCAQNSTFNTAAPLAPRPPFPCAPPHNVFNNGGNQLPLSPIPGSMNCNRGKVPVELPEQRNQFNELNMLSDLWVEALAAGGRKYYFNARTRKTVWEKPVNVRIISLDEIKRLRTCSRGECPQNQPNENQQPPFVQQQSFSPYSNSFFPRNFSMPPRVMMFPNPQNVCNPPVLSPSTEIIQETIDCTFNPMVRPAIFPFSVHGNMMPSYEISDYDPSVSCSEANGVSEQVGSQTSCIDDESKISEWSISESSVSFGSTGNEGELCSCEKMDDSVVQQFATSEKMDESVVQQFATPEKMDESVVQQFATSEKMDERMVQQSSKNSEDIQNEAHQSSDDSSTVVKECGKSKEPAESKHEKQHVDKSRPVASTPVPGTFWYIVWTGDEKVFFYDSQNNASVWERPVELINRTDVDKLIEKSPLSVDLKTEKKEVRKTTSDGSDVIKKLKKDDEEENQELDENFGLKEEATDAKDAKEVTDPKLDAIPHERRVEMFREMLTENKVSPFSSWEKELHKIIFDSRYLLLPSKERRQVFDLYVSNKLEEEKNEHQQQLHNQRKNFIALLEEAGVNSKSRFSEFARNHGKDVRFKSVEKLRQRENMFNQYVSNLIKKDRENEKLLADQKKKFIELLNEQKFSNKDTTWDDVQKDISSDERFKAIKSNSMKEKLFKEYIRGKASSFSPTEREERISASIRNREEEVKRDLSIHLKNREREQELHKQKSAMSDFKALLNDLIRESDTSWHSAKKILRQDHRWEYMQDLEYEKREEIFEQHINSLNSKKREHFHRMLDEVPDVTLKSSWLDVRKSVLSDSRCSKFSSSERKCEKEFKNYLKMKIHSMKSDFKELLRETKLISYKSKTLLATTSHLKDIEGVLSQDKRYLNLECIRSERREILLSYIDELHAEGPPPPPTATPSTHLKANK